jgi:dTDP-D-glucose 4,6-dehydratase
MCDEDRQAERDEESQGGAGTRELGWRAEEDFESGIAKTVRWYIDQKPWWTAILRRGSAAQRVGLSE